MTTHSAIYVGHVTHVRRRDVQHAFTHRLFMLYLDLDEVARLPLFPVLGVERPGLLSFRRRDYRGDPARPLKQSVLDDVEAVTGERPDGPVRLLTHVRSLGPAFNPVSFYYCFLPGGQVLHSVVAEITNTPWGERHAYVVPASGPGARGDFRKAFHVSPFLPMTQRYSWSLSAPGADLSVRMRNLEDDQVSFLATLSLVRRPLTRPTLVAVALAQPLMSLRVMALIYWQALRLWLKSAPFFAHPSKGPTTPRLAHGLRTPGAVEHE